MKRALILVDIQNDFVTGGALEVPQGEAIIPTVNKLQEVFDIVIATQDWHPVAHGSFAANHTGKSPGEVIDLNGLDQILWPVHCVKNTSGAAFVNELSLEKVQKIFVKGTDTAIDSYSGFFDNGKRKSTKLDEYLKSLDVTDVYIVGLAADYCVKFTALDAAELEFNTFLVTDATKGVNLNEGDVEQAIEEMQQQGVQLISSQELLQ